jgi:outer membrane protein TolC
MRPETKGGAEMNTPAWRVVLTVALAAWSPPAWAGPAAPAGLAGDVRRLTLEEAKQLALANNKALQLARLNVQEKQHATSAAKKDYFPKVLGNVTYFHFNEDLGRVVTVQRGARGILAPGARTLSVAVLNQDSALSTVFLAQPITKLVAVHAAVQIASADEVIAQAKLDKGAQDLLSGVAQAYYALAGARRIQAALELQIGLLEQLAAAKPVAELRVGLLEARQGLLQVRSQAQELTATLNNLLDLPPCTALELVDPVPPDAPVRCADDAAQRAVSCSAEVREAEQNIAKAQAAYKVAKMDYVPDVNVIGGYANQTVADYIQPSIGYVGVTATYTFWDWCKRKEVKHQREATMALAHQNLQVTTDKVQLEARKLYGAYEQAREALRLAREMAQVRKDAEKGAKDPEAVVAARGATARAELELMKADIAYRVAHAQLMGVICAAE